MNKPHRYRALEGWCDFESLYQLVVDHVPPSDSVLVEVGAYKGRSACYMAEALRIAGKRARFVTVDPWPGQLRADFVTGLQGAGIVLGETPRDESSWIDYEPCDVEMFQGTSIEASAYFIDRSCDFVFIDADHGEQAVSADLRAWWSKIRLGGIFAGHDYRPFGGASHVGVKRAVDRFASEIGARLYLPGTSWAIVKR